MNTTTMKAGLYKLIDALPETSLQRAKRILERLISSTDDQPETMTPEDEAWFRSADEDTMKALEAIESDIPKEDLAGYLRAIEQTSKPVKWDPERGVFVVRKSR